MVACGVLTMFFMMGLFAFGRSAVFKASLVIAGASLYAIWYLANAIAYTVKRYGSPTYCSADVRVRFSPILVPLKNDMH
jgi:hypothetical protein